MSFVRASFRNARDSCYGYILEMFGNVYGNDLDLNTRQWRKTELYY